MHQRLLSRSGKSTLSAVWPRTADGSFDCDNDDSGVVVVEDGEVDQGQNHPTFVVGLAHVRHAAQYKSCICMVYVEYILDCMLHHTNQSM